MALIATDSGCKVGWETYDNEEEAKARAVTARAEAAGMASRGYDFGYQSPGSVTRRREYTEKGPDGKVNASGPWVWLDEWIVTVP